MIRVRISVFMLGEKYNLKNLNKIKKQQQKQKQRIIQRKTTKNIHKKSQK